MVSILHLDSTDSGDTQELKRLVYVTTACVYVNVANYYLHNLVIIKYKMKVCKI